MKLLEHVRQTARVKHFSYRTEKAYVYWAERYIRFHRIRHPNLMGTAEIEQFLTHLAALRGMFPPAPRIKPSRHSFSKATRPAPSENDSFVHCEQNRCFAHLKEGDAMRAGAPGGGFEI